MAVTNAQSFKNIGESEALSDRAFKDISVKEPVADDDAKAYFGRVFNGWTQVLEKYRTQTIVLETGFDDL